MVVYLYLVLLLNAATSGVATQATATANPARRSLGDQVTRKAQAVESSRADLDDGRVVGSLIGSDAPWREQALGRTLAAKRRRRSVFHPNRRSAFVSLGMVRPFTGDVYPSGALASALETRSFRRELILITDTRPRAALQSYDNLAQLGLVHVLWLTNSQSICSAADGLLAARADLRRARAASEQLTSASTHGVAGGAEGTLGGGRALQANAGVQEVEVEVRQLELDVQAGGRLPAMGDSTNSGHARGLRAAQTPPPSNTSAAMAVLAAASEAAASRRRNSISGITAPATSADVGCAWYSQPFPDVFVGHRRLMMRRLMLLARAVRLGYNVLSLDADVVVFREPYIFFKSPPYASAHMVVGKSVRGGSMVNTGVMYFQNVSRTGPVSWLMTEAVERNLRWLDHTPAAAATATAAAAAAPLLTPPEAEKRGCWDQFLFADSLLTSLTGRLSLYYCARPPEGLLAKVGGRRADEDSGWNKRHRAALGLVERQSPAELFARDTTVVTDPELLSLVAADSFLTSWANLTIPTDPPPLLSDEPGYSLPARLPGGGAAQFLQLLAEDDSHPASSQQVAGRAAARRLAASAEGGGRWRLLDGVGAAGAGAGPGGLECRTVEAAGGGCKGTVPLEGEPGAAGRQLQQVGVSSSGDGDGDGSSSSGGDGDGDSSSSGEVADAAADSLQQKHRDVERLAYAADWLVGGWTQRGVLGYWDPALTNGVPRQVFAHLVRAPGPTSIGKEAVRMQYGEYNWELAALSDGGPFPFLGSANASELPRVVALLPNVDTSTATPIQWSNMARGLAQLALLTGRRVVWPAVPCASKWVQPNPGSRRALPLNPNLRFLAHGSFSSGLMCTPAVALHQKCLFERWTGGRNDTAAAASSSSNSTGLPPKEEVAEVPRREGPRGLLPIEFEMLLRVLPAEAQPGPHNTVHLQANDDYDDGGGSGERPVMFDEPPRTEGITYVKASAVAGPLRQGPLAAQPVLYFAQRTFLTQLDKLGDADMMARYRIFRNECPALK